MSTAETTTKKYVSRRRHLEEIEADIRDRISSGKWTSGMMIPSRRDLAREYCVDLNVVQRALSSLIADKTLVAGVGRGTFVAELSATALRSVAPVASSEPPIERSSIVSNVAATVGVVATMWAYNQSTREPHDNWPAAMLHAFEWGMASMPHVTVKFKNAKSELYGSGVAELLAEGIDALALIMPSQETVAEVEILAERTGLPVVLIREEGDNVGGLPSVFYDGEYAGFQAAQHLVQRGYDNISFYNPFAEAWWTETRRFGVEAALRKAGKSLVAGRDLGDRPQAGEVDQREAGREAGASFLANRLESCGIVAVNDHAGHGLLDAAAAMGLTAGRDFGLIGFDDLSESRVMDMTSLHPPLDAMGAEAAKLLQNSMAGIRTTTEVRLRSHLVSRSSTQSLRSVAVKPRLVQWTGSSIGV